MSMRPRSSTWEWGAFADAMRYAKGSYDLWAAKPLFAAIRASFVRWLQRDRVAHVSTVTTARSVTDHGGRRSDSATARPQWTTGEALRIQRCGAVPRGTLYWSALSVSVPRRFAPSGAL